MQLLSLTINNFGIYSGRHTFDLAPHAQDQFQRPIILFRGKNGVGKTTLVEAIKICLYGRVALSNNMSLKEYGEHITQRLHHPPNNGKGRRAASVKLVFEHLSTDIPVKYVVERKWKLTKTGVNEQVEIYVDGSSPSWLKPEMKDPYIRELIPPHMSSLLFIDGEKLDLLVRQFTNNHAFPSIFKEFLGLSLISQLQQDLDIFISKQLSENGHGEYDERLEAANKYLQRAKEDISKNRMSLQKTASEIQEVQERLENLEQKYASEGGYFAESFAELHEEINAQENAIDSQLRAIQEFCNHLVPFSVSPNWLRRVQDRILLEDVFQTQNISKALIRKQANELAALLTNDGFWETVGIQTDETSRKAVIKKLKQSIRKPAPNKRIKEKDIILFLSTKDQEVLSSWIAEALGAIPKAFSEAVAEYKKALDEKARIQKELNMVPPDEKIREIYEDILTGREELEKLTESEEKIILQLEDLERRQEFHEAEIRRAREEIGKKNKLSNKIAMASSAQILLDEYSYEVLDHKMRAIEQSFLTRFNSLCLKDSFIEGIRIDRKTFTITLQRNGRDFSHTELSAGETQLFVLSLIWAIRDISMLQLPMIFDTPLARLDKGHRQSTLTEFFPKVSHQLILLATDAEIDTNITTDLSPVISHGYGLSFDAKHGNTIVEPLEGLLAPTHQGN